MKGLSYIALGPSLSSTFPAHAMKAAIQSQEIIYYHPDSFNLAVSFLSSVALQLISWYSRLVFAITQLKIALQ